MIERFILSYPVFFDSRSPDAVPSINMETIDFQPTIVFLNGEYWGIHTIRDYVDQNYINYK